MQTCLKRTETKHCDPTIDDELADVLTAISVVSKRLALKLMMLSLQEKQNTEGEKNDEQDE